MAEREIIGLLNPGEMGAAFGQRLASSGHTVLWASDGRSEETAARAKAAGLTDVGSVRQLTADAAVILSICPPHAALDVAWAVHGFTGLYVDGSIIGPPPLTPGTTRLYLSGEHAGDIHDLFQGTGLEPRVTAGTATAASAVKMAYAAYTKGIAALLLASRALAQAEGVEDALLAEWAVSQPQLAEQSARAARSSGTKGWRWVGEMEEIAQSMAAAGLPDGFHQAAAEIFRRCPRGLGTATGDDILSHVLAAITG